MYKRLSRVDLNLLVSLNVLLQEKNATRAAEALFLTPSAMSKILARLREVFDDELFVRTPSGLEPTLKAEMLKEPLSQMLQNADNLLFPDSFNPLETKATIAIAIVEPTAVLLTENLFRRFKLAAPNLILQIQNVGEDYKQRLEDGRLDFCIYPDECGSDLSAQLIGGAKLACLMREGHPLSKPGAWDGDAFLHAEKIVYFSPDSSQFSLKKWNKELRQVVSIPQVNVEIAQLFTGVEMLLKTDCIMLSAEGMQNSLLGDGKIIEKPVPDIYPFYANKLDLFLISHQRLQFSPLHQWVAEQVKEIVSEILPIHDEKVL